MKKCTKNENCIGKITNKYYEAVIFPIKIRKKRK